MTGTREVLLILPTVQLPHTIDGQRIVVALVPFTH